MGILAWQAGTLSPGGTALGRLFRSDDGILADRTKTRWANSAPGCCGPRCRGALFMILAYTTPKFFGQRE